MRTRPDNSAYIHGLAAPGRVTHRQSRVVVRARSKPSYLFSRRLLASSMATKNETPKTRAEAAFTHSEQRDRQVMRMIENERAAVDAKTAKLKAQRLAKEAAEPPALKTVSKRKSPAAKSAGQSRDKPLESVG